MNIMLEHYRVAPNLIVYYLAFVNIKGGNSARKSWGAQEPIFVLSFVIALHVVINPKHVTFCWN